MTERFLKLLLKLFWGERRAFTAEDVRTVYAPDGKHRVTLVRRGDGLFFYREELFNDKLLDMRWEPGRGGPEKGCASAGDALAEARKALEWLWTVEDR